MLLVCGSIEFSIHKLVLDTYFHSLFLKPLNLLGLWLYNNIHVCISENQHPQNQVRTPIFMLISIICKPLQSVINSARIKSGDATYCPEITRPLWISLLSVLHFLQTQVWIWLLVCGFSRQKNLKSGFPWESTLKDANVHYFLLIILNGNGSLVF